MSRHSVALVGEIYDAMNSGGWRWANLTSGEQNQYGAPIVMVLAALDDAGYEVRKRDEAKP